MPTRQLLLRLYYPVKEISEHARASDAARNSGPATRAKVDRRTHELAVLAGRIPPYVTQVDYQQAKRELTGETDLDRQNAMLDRASASDPRGA